MVKRLAEYQANAGERLDALLRRAYGSVTDANILAAYYANRDLPLVFDGGELVDLPDAPAPPDYAPDAVEWEYDAPPVQVAPYTDHHTGAAGDAPTAIRWAIISRCLTPQGDIFNMPAYGSQFYTLLGNLQDDATRAAAEAICAQAVEVDVGFYAATFAVGSDGTTLLVDANGDTFGVELG